MRSRSLLVLLPVVASFLAVSAATAATIDNVTVLPLGAIPEGSTVLMRIEVGTPSSEASLFFPTAASRSGTDISVSLYVEAGLLQIPDSIVEIVNFGILPVGDYDYTIYLNTPSLFPADTVTGSFTVVPEPSSLLLISLGLGALASMRSTRRAGRPLSG